MSEQNNSHNAELVNETDSICDETGSFRGKNNILVWGRVGAMLLAAM